MFDRNQEHEMSSACDDWKERVGRGESYRHRDDSDDSIPQTKSKGLSEPMKALIDRLRGKAMQRQLAASSSVVDVVAEQIASSGDEYIK